MARWPWFPLLLAGLITLGVTTGPIDAHADDDASELDVTFNVVSGDTITARFDVTNALTDAFRKRLINGLTSRVVMKLKLFDPSGAAIATTSRRCNFQFDIWDELLEVQIWEGSLGYQALKRKVIDHGLQDCGIVRGVKLANRSLLRFRSGYQLEVLVQLNPVSERQLQRAREFMSNPRRTGTRRPSGFFDTVASFFGGGPRDRDDEFLFRSKLLGRPNRGGR